MIENKDEIIKELREILNKNRINSKEERKLYFFKLRDLKNKAIYYNDDETIELLYMYEKSMNDKTSGLMAAYEEGIEQGIEEEIERGIEQGKKEAKLKTAKKMLLKNLDIQDILELTELSIEEIEELR